MKQREGRHYQMISSRELLCVFSPIKVTHFTILFLAYKRVDYEMKCFSSTPHVISTRIKRQCASLISDR